MTIRGFRGFSVTILFIGSALTVVATLGPPSFLFIEPTYGSELSPRVSSALIKEFLKIDLGAAFSNAEERLTNSLVRRALARIEARSSETGSSFIENELAKFEGGSSDEAKIEIWKQSKLRPLLKIEIAALDVERLDSLAHPFKSGLMKIREIEFEGSNAAEETTTLGREFSGITNGNVYPESVLAEIQKTRGGVITNDPKIPGKVVLTDRLGLKWGAEIDGIYARGGTKQPVIEVQTPPLYAEENELLNLPIKAFLRLGVEPKYSVGGGHIHIGLDGGIGDDPKRFASLVNLLLSYEDLLAYVFSNPARVHTIKKWSQVRTPSGQYLSSKSGEALNRAITKGDSGFLWTELQRIAEVEAPSREMAINLKSWKGSTTKKTHGTLELRFFNQPKSTTEAQLEERLVRLLVRRASVGDTNPYLYHERISPIVGENALLRDDFLFSEWDSLKTDLGMSAEESEAFTKTFLNQLSDRRHPGH